MPQTACQMSASGQTDVGRVRARNEDYWSLEADIGLALVCDGMGGHAGGDVASRTAAATICASVRAHLRERLLGGAGGRGMPDGETAAAIVQAAVRSANRRLHALNRERGFPEGRGMGTTVAGLWRLPGSDRLIAFHAGDSRLYRLRDGELAQLTRDHSLYQMWLDGGAEGTAPPKNIIVRALGTGAKVEPEIAVHAVAAGDLYLLCSDGLNAMLPDEAIRLLLLRSANSPASAPAGQDEKGLESACATLIEAANQAGGQDNVTVLLVRFDRPVSDADPVTEAL
ncbi:protein phosphatase 2C domain-containing protein [Azospirillum sp. SYSU D00513]|uniref:PP2C family protein-serine/threonine phosphatase n=1 Tax=Azospirillum sp. SYSU D00513 TaxID=2812561 RepID=UPI001A972091|nr:protein phosphatase 2C domain-containing protein [Azospirillum sp. SYSU D00513]